MSEINKEKNRDFEKMRLKCSPIWEKYFSYIYAKKHKRYEEKKQYKELFLLTHKILFVLNKIILVL